MKRILLLTIAICLMVGPAFEVYAQDMGAASGKTLASTMNVYVFPTEGQAADALRRAMAAWK